MQLCAAVISRGAVRQRKAKVKKASRSSWFIVSQQFLYRWCLVRVKGQAALSLAPPTWRQAAPDPRALHGPRYPLCCLVMMPPSCSHTACRNHVRRDPPGRGDELWLAALPAPPWQYWGSTHPLHSPTQLHSSANPLPTSHHLGKTLQTVTAQTNKQKNRFHVQPSSMPLSSFPPGSFSYPWHSSDQQKWCFSCRKSHKEQAHRKGCSNLLL